MLDMIFIEAFFTSKMSHGFTVHGLINFICGHKKNTAFPVPVVMKLTNVQQHYINFYPNRTVNVESRYRNSFMPRNKVWLSLCQISRNVLSLKTLL